MKTKKLTLLLTAAMFLMGGIMQLKPKLWILVWALVARFMSNGCSSHVHQFPITWSPRDRLESMVGTLCNRFVYCQ